MNKSFKDLLIEDFKTRRIAAFNEPQVVKKWQWWLLIFVVVLMAIKLFALT